MRQDIQDYVTKCIVCQKVKYDRGKAPGLLQPLPILDAHGKVFQWIYLRITQVHTRKYWHMNNS